LVIHHLIVACFDLLWELYNRAEVRSFNKREFFRDAESDARSPPEIRRWTRQS